MTNRSSPRHHSTIIAAALAATTALAPMTAYAGWTEATRALHTTGAGQASRPTVADNVQDVEELAELGARQRASGALADFAGGEPVVIIGVSTMLLVLLVVFLVLILT